MDRQGGPLRRLESVPRSSRAAFVTIERRLGAPRLFATAYSTVGSSIYFALGVVAAYALGLTPVVFLVAGLLFVLTTLTYFEGLTAHPERGGSAVMARYAFNEFWSFVAGWAILLDYLILIAISSLSIGHYLTAFWSKLGEDRLDLAIAVLVLAGIARYNYMGFAPRGRRGTALAMIDLVLILLIVGLGAALVFDLGAVTNTVELGSVPRWPDLLYGMTIAVIAYTGIEAASNLAPEVRVSRKALRRTISAGAVVVLFLFIGMSTIALMALPVETGVPLVGGAPDTGFGTELGGQFVEAPVLGVVQGLTSSWVSEVLGYVVAVVATLVLIEAANVGMVGITRTSYMLATHRQIPRVVARLHPRHTTPWIVIAIACALVFLLLLPVDIELLAGTFAYGALLAFALAHLSVCAMRFRDPERSRPFKVPLNVRVRGCELPLPAALGALLSLAAWVGVLIYHDEARLIGTAWMLFGLAAFVVYRSRQGLSLTRVVEVSPTTLAGAEPEVEYGSILVPVFGEALDDDIVSTAGQLAAEERPGDSRGAMIEAIYVAVVPMSLPIDARLPADQVERAREALERAKRIAEEYEGVEVVTSAVRGRRTGATIVEQARRHHVEAIVIGAEPPSPIKGGGLLGGVGGSRPRELGEITAYVLEKAPCRVVVTAPPDGARTERGPDGEAVD
jgi:APA family basic amino acid/polyamine antiporter